MKSEMLEVIGEYVQLTKSGKNYFGRCPFHNEKTPSFSVSVDKQIYHCFGCGVTGDAEAFKVGIKKAGVKPLIINATDLFGDTVNKKNDEGLQ